MRQPAQCIRVGFLVRTRARCKRNCADCLLCSKQRAKLKGLAGLPQRVGEERGARARKPREVIERSSDYSTGVRQEDPKKKARRGETRRA